MAVTEV